MNLVDSMNSMNVVLRRYSKRRKSTSIRHTARNKKLAAIIESGAGGRALAAGFSPPSPR